MVGKELESSIQETFKQITVGVKPYFRCVGRFIGNISDERGTKTQIAVEKILQSIFDPLECSYIRTYDVSEIEPQRRNQ